MWYHLGVETKNLTQLIFYFVKSKPTPSIPAPIPVIVPPGTLLTSIVPIISAVDEVSVAEYATISLSTIRKGTNTTKDSTRTPLPAIA